MIVFILNYFGNASVLYYLLYTFEIMSSKLTHEVIRAPCSSKTKKTTH